MALVPDRQRYGLVGGVGDGNTGNEVSLDVVRRLLGEELGGARFAIITPMPEGARRTIAAPGDLVLPLRAARPAVGVRSAPVILRRLTAEVAHVIQSVHAAGGLHAIVVCGTGVLDDFEEPPWGMPWSLLLWAIAARARRRPFVLLAVGAGPINGRVSRVLFRATVRLATTVSYRDEASRRTMDAIGANRHDARVTCDLAFGHDVAPGRPAAPGPRMRVGIGVMDWSGWSGGDDCARERYRTLLLETAIGLVERGHQVLLLVGQPVDVPLAEEVRQGVLRALPPAASAVEVAPCGSFDDLCAAVQGTDVVVAARFHTIVAGVMCDRPVVSTGYAPKNRELLATVGVEDADMGVDVVTTSWLLDRVDAAATGNWGRADPGVVAEWRAVTREELRLLARSLGVRQPGRLLSGSPATSRRP